MSITQFSRIVIRRGNGTAEVIGRKGHHDPHRAAREMSGFGEVVAVRHMLHHDDSKKVETVAIHNLKP